MQVMDWTDITQAAVAHVGKPAVYVRNGLAYDRPKDDAIFAAVREQIKEQYGDVTTEYFDLMTAIIYSGLIFFDTEEEQNRFYRIFEHPLVDSSAIYACTYDRTGKCQTENT